MTKLTREEAVEKLGIIVEYPSTLPLGMLSDLSDVLYALSTGFSDDPPPLDPARVEKARTLAGEIMLCAGDDKGGSEAPFCYACRDRAAEQLRLLAPPEGGGKT